MRVEMDRKLSDAIKQAMDTPGCEVSGVLADVIEQESRRDVRDQRLYTFNEMKDWTRQSYWWGFACGAMALAVGLMVAQWLR